MVYSTRHQMAAVCRTCQQCLHTSRVHVSGESGSGRSRSSRSVPEYRAPIPTLPYTRAAILPEPQSSSSTGPSSFLMNQPALCQSAVDHLLRRICHVMRLSPSQIETVLSSLLPGKVWFHTGATRGRQHQSDEEQSSSDESGRGDDGGKWNKGRMFLGFVLGYLAFSAMLSSRFGRRQIPQSTMQISWSEFEHQLLARGEVTQLVVYPDMGAVLVFLHSNAVVNGRLLGDQPLLLTVPNLHMFESKLRDAENRLGISMNDRIPVIYDGSQGAVAGTLFALLFGAVIMYFVLSSFRGGITSAFNKLSSFSRAKFTVVNSMTGEGRGVKFSDVAGLHEAKQEVKEFVDYLKRPEYYLNLGAKVPKGALLLGPPGCGKTLLAKAVATEGRVPFINMNGSEFIEMIGGLGASRVRDLFREARKRAPCIVYIDEIDAIGRARNAGSSSTGRMDGEMEQTLNQLLVEMDGMTTKGSVVMLASTNRADLLDKALLRPGRFDRHITIDLPTLIERRQIFEHHLGSILLLNKPRHYSHRLAQLTPGFSGADIMNVCNESALKAARDGHTSVTEADLEYAVERVVGGTEKRSHVLSPNQRRVVAMHESGHALTGWLLEHTDALLSVSIVPRTRGMLGLSRHVPSDQKLYTTEQLFDRMCMALGGRVAEAVVFNTVTDGAKNDLERVTKMAYAQVREYGMNERLGPLSYDSRAQSGRRPYSRHMASLIDRAASDLVARAYRRTEHLLAQNTDKLKTLADALMTRDSLKYDDVLSLIGPPPYGSKRTVSSDEFEGSMGLGQKRTTEKGD